MPRNGSGTYSKPAGTTAVAGQRATATKYNELADDMASAMTDSLSRSGDGGMLDDLAMGGFKVTGMGTPSASTDAATKGYVDTAQGVSGRGGGSWATAVAGTADAITVTLSPVPAAYAAGMLIRFVAGANNTGAATVNVNSLGAIALRKGDGSVALAAGDVVSGMVVEAIYETGAPNRFRILSDPTALASQLAIVSGDMIYGSGTKALARLPKGTDGQVQRLVAGLPAWVADPFAGQLFHAREEEPANTDGGTFTSGSFIKRTLNTIKTNEITSATLTSSVISLPAGTYYCVASAPGREVAGHVAKLRNTTDGADLLVGTVESSGTTAGTQTRSWVVGRFTLAGTKNIELQHRCQTTSATTGLGDAANVGVVEVYSEIMIWRVL